MTRTEDASAFRCWTQTIASTRKDSEKVTSPTVERWSWRMDGEESICDWTIEIFSKETKFNADVDFDILTYRVHKCALAAEDRRYLHNLLIRGGRFSETRSSISRIELCSKAYPDLLDFLYRADLPSSCKSRTKKATRLCYLANCLKIRARSFWKHETYLEQAHQLHRSGNIKLTKIVASTSGACR